MNAIQKNITSVWKKILKMDDINPNENFFELGGNSIKAMLIATNLTNKFNINFDIHDIFENPTIYELSKKAECQIAVNIQKIQPIALSDSYAVSNAQMRVWLISQNETQSIAYNVHSSFLFEGNLCIDSFTKAFEKIVERHESLRTNFDFLRGEIRQIIHENITLPLELIDLSNTSNNLKNAEELYIKEAETIFNLKTDPLFRIKLVKLGLIAGKESYVFIFNAHHIICDGWSNDILLKELNQFYVGYRENKPIDLEPLSIQYRDFAAWKNSFLESDEVELHRNYWLNKLSGKLLPPLPINNLDNSIKDSRGQYYRFKINKDLKKSIDDFCADNEITLHILMVSITKVVLSYYSSQQDIIIASPVAERTHPELISQIGFYLNTLILKDSVKDEESFAELLNKVKKTIFDGLKHQVYPIDVLVNDLCIDNHSIESLFSIIVNVLDYRGYDVNILDGIESKRFMEISSTTHSDLQIMVVHTEDIEIALEYRSALFSIQAIMQIEKFILLLLDMILKDFNIKISCLKSKMLICDKQTTLFNLSFAG